jgi:hypothetical protein
VKAAKAAAWATTTANAVYGALAESSVLISTSYHEHVLVKDNKVPIDVKSLVSSRSLEQYAEDYNDEDFDYLKIAVLTAAAGGRGKSLR